MSDKDYAELIAEAEKAVANVKDPELKRIAFEKILDTLLGQGKSSQSSRRGKSANRSAKKGPKTAKSGSQPKKRKATPRGPKAYVRELHEEGFFKKPKTISHVRSELANRGHHIPLTSLSGPMQSLCQDRVLRRSKGKEGKKSTYLYSNW